MRYLAVFIAIVLWTAQGFSEAPAGDLVDLLDRVVSLDITRSGYTLGKKLTGEQREMARNNAVTMENQSMMKFLDGDAHVVVEKNTERVVILYEQYEPVSREKIETVVGELFFDFGEPTVFAHDKVIYWVYGPKGKLSENAFKTTKDKKEAPDILATIKLNSSLKIMDKKDTAPNPSLYYIMSSQPVLEQITQKKMNIERPTSNVEH